MESRRFQQEPRAAVEPGGCAGVFQSVLARAKPRLSDEHFTVDGTLMEAWASQKSFQKKDGSDSDGAQFPGERRSNDTHQSKTDPEAKLYRKGNGQEAKLGFLGHVLMENRHGLIVDAMLTQADGMAERDAALLMVHRQWRRNRRWGPRKPISLGADKGYDTRDFVGTLRHYGVRVHVAQNAKRTGGSTIDQRTARHASYQMSQRKATADREGVRMDEADRRNAEDEATRTVESRMAVFDDCGGVQSAATRKVAIGGPVDALRPMWIFSTRKTLPVLAIAGKNRSSRVVRGDSNDCRDAFSTNS